jgi:hypothetical protein
VEQFSEFALSREAFVEPIFPSGYRTTQFSGNTGRAAN